MSTTLQEPTFDRAGYPSEETLSTIAGWNGDTDSWLDYCAKAWSTYGRVWEDSPGEMHFATAGWSGNESVVSAMQENMRWSLCWLSSHRGGLHVFCRDSVKPEANDCH